MNPQTEKALKNCDKCIDGLRTLYQDSAAKGNVNILLSYDRAKFIGATLKELKSEVERLQNVIKERTEQIAQLTMNRLDK